jgi:hypothetical protein
MVSLAWPKHDGTYVEMGREIRFGDVIVYVDVGWRIRRPLRSAMDAD